MSGTKKKIILCVLCIISALYVLVPIARHLIELKLQVPDTNGESKELCYFTDEFIEGCYTDYRIIQRRVESKENHSSGVQGEYEDFDSNYSRTTTGKLSGVYILNAYLGNGGVVKYTIDSKVEEGNLRIVVTNEDGKILYDLPIDEKAEFEFQTEKDETYYVKLVGESAKVSVELWREVVNP